MRLTLKRDDAKLTARIRIYKIFLRDVTEQTLCDVRSDYAPEARRQSNDVSICFYMHMKLYATETS
jgi:hypothetical protein